MKSGSQAKNLDMLLGKTHDKKKKQHRENHNSYTIEHHHQHRIKLGLRSPEAKLDTQ